MMAQKWVEKHVTSGGHRAAVMRLKAVEHQAQLCAQAFGKHERARERGEDIGHKEHQKRLKTGKPIHFVSAPTCPLRHRKLVQAHEARSRQRLQGGAPWSALDLRDGTCPLAVFFIFVYSHFFRLHFKIHPNKLGCHKARVSLGPLCYNAHYLRTLFFHTHAHGAFGKSSLLAGVAHRPAPPSASTLLSDAASSSMRCGAPSTPQVTERTVKME